MLRGTATIILLLLNLMFWGTAVVLLGIVKFVVHMTAPRSGMRTRVILALSGLFILAFRSLTLQQRLRNSAILLGAAMLIIVPWAVPSLDGSSIR